MGRFEVYRNDALPDTRDVSAWPFFDDGGHLGLWTDRAIGTLLDDFGGGTVP